MQKTNPDATEVRPFEDWSDKFPADEALSPVTPQELRQDADDLDPLVPYHPEIQRHLLAAAAQLERQERVIAAARALAKEATGFLGMAHPAAHGVTNIRVLQGKIDAFWQELEEGK